MSSDVVVIGSINGDLAVSVDALPHPGQTVLGKGCGFSIGGKGFNQAMAAKRAGASVMLVGAVGDDELGAQALKVLNKAEIDTSQIAVLDTPTGYALITVSSSGENTIAVAPGANGALSINHVAAAKSTIESARIVVAQCEIPPEVIQAAFAMARAAGVMTLLNPAPATPQLCPLLPLADFITPNRDELYVLSGVEYSAWETDPIPHAIEALRGRGATTIVATLGADGSAISWKGKVERLPAFPVKAVDTTGAGDVFTGVLAAGITAGLDLTDAATRAQAAAALSVQRVSADSAPMAQEIDALLRSVREGGAK